MKTLRTRIQRNRAQNDSLMVKLNQTVTTESRERKCVFTQLQFNMNVRNELARGVVKLWVSHLATLPRWLSQDSMLRASLSCCAHSSYSNFVRLLLPPFCQRGVAYIYLSSAAYWTYWESYKSAEHVPSSSKPVVLVNNLGLSPPKKGVGSLWKMRRECCFSPLEPEISIDNGPSFLGLNEDLTIGIDDMLNQIDQLGSGDPFPLNGELSLMECGLNNVPYPQQTVDVGNYRSSRPLPGGETEIDGAVIGDFLNKVMLTGENEGRGISHSVDVNSRRDLVEMLKQGKNKVCGGVSNPTISDSLHNFNPFLSQKIKGVIDELKRTEWRRVNELVGDPTLLTLLLCRALCSDGKSFSEKSSNMQIVSSAP
ncbi:hypothetical protein Tco_1275692 [Tanacetum coccineum]